MKRFSIAMTALILSGLGLSAPALAQGYNVRPGDVLKIEVAQDPSMNRTVLVAPDGRITVPLAGSVVAQGRSVEAVAGSLATALGPQFASAPDVYVALERLSDRTPGMGAGNGAKALGPSVHVVGAAAKPGRHALARNTSVLQFFGEMGGFDKFAATKRVQLRRGDKTYVLNYEDILSGASNAGNTILQAGDVIVIPQRRLFE